MGNRQPDRVPAAPDLYEMVPIRLWGRPCWESLVYADPPIWKLRMDACAHYGADAFVFLDSFQQGSAQQAVVYRSDRRLIARWFTESDCGICWSPDAFVYPREGPSAQVKAKKIGLPDAHEKYEVVTRQYTRTGRDCFEDARAYVGEGGVVAPMVSIPALPPWEEDAIEYLENPEVMEARIEQRGKALIASVREILSWKPDILLIGNSGMMLFNPPDTFRKLSLKWLQQITRMAKEQNVLTHLHCCGPERKLVEIAARETDLSAIEPLEIPPMGDCVLKDIKREFGGRVALKGNLHTTDVMLLGTPHGVEEACRRTIDDAAAGGGFILSTGDQTPRDAPDANIFKVVECAEKYGTY